MTLREAPTDVAQLVERLMLEDLQSTTLTPGQPAPTLSSRAWVEHRSRIGAYKTAAHAAWMMAGALDCLRGDVQGCRARLGLGLLQLDQTAIDRGSWTLSSDLSLEPPPPFAGLAQHVLPDPQRGDSPFSRLLVSRWAEISMAHLQDTDTYLTKRKNLGKASLDQKDAAEQRRRSRKGKQAKQCPCKRRFFSHLCSWGESIYSSCCKFVEFNAAMGATDQMRL